jgi:hypothetical protein
MVDDPATGDKIPRDINVYGWAVIYRRDGVWIVDQCDEYSNLPAHYPFMDQALDRVSYLRSKGVECRVSALLAEPTDTVEEFERSKIDG